MSLDQTREETFRTELTEDTENDLSKNLPTFLKAV
jgi:hypothetical protein